MLPKAVNSLVILSEQQLRLWLFLLNEEEHHSMKALWEKYNPKDSPLSVNRFANGIRNELREIGAKFVAHRITAQQWYDETRRLMKLSYQIVIDKQTPHPDNTKVVEAVIVYFLLLNKFASGIADGEIPLDGHIAPRTGMYGSSVYSVAKNWELFGWFGQDMECRRVLGPNENHCHTDRDTEGCPELAAKGWMPVEQMTPISEATCRSNCLCTLEYRKKKPQTLLSDLLD